MRNPREGLLTDVLRAEHEGIILGSLVARAGAVAREGAIQIYAVPLVAADVVGKIAVTALIDILAHLVSLRVHHLKTLIAFAFIAIELVHASAMASAGNAHAVIGILTLWWVLEVAIILARQGEVADPEFLCLRSVDEHLSPVDRGPIIAPVGCIVAKLDPGFRLQLSIHEAERGQVAFNPLALQVLVCDLPICSAPSLEHPGIAAVAGEAKPDLAAVLDQLSVGQGLEPSGRGAAGIQRAEQKSLHRVGHRWQIALNRKTWDYAFKLP
mmetsp:Transcript_63656/g.138647  ORF Transcript_63656/g.138647 Transcript_63656/m.138647 type:complete len:269 (-) Transcript_63656:2529-3335(-)